VTTTAATSNTSAQGQRRPSVCASVTTPSIQIVRCDGTPQPENTAYAVAHMKPPQRAAIGTGTRNMARALRRQSRAIRPPDNQANIVMCKPLIETKCAMPVLR
jgi:hypothetical protein